MATEFIPVAIAQFWQVTLLILVVAALSRWLSPRRPHLSHLLWLVVLIKCVTPPLWASPGGVFCWLQPEQQIDTPLVESIEWAPVAWDEMLDVENTPLVDSEVSDAPFAGVYLDEAPATELTAASNVAESASDESSSDWLDDAAFVSWSVISCLVLLGVTIRWLRFWKLVRSSPRRDSTELDTTLQTLSKQLRVRRRVRLIVTESLVGPAVVGFFRVTVLIPAVIADKLKGKSVEAILAHELLHIRRGNLWVGLLQTVAQALWWFHPLVWWVGRATSREAERCCDEEVLGELKCDPGSYARALLDVLDLKSQLKPVPVFPGVRPVDVTSQRLERIMLLRQGCRRRSPWWCWLVAIGAAALTLPGAAFVVTAQDEESSEPATKEEFKALPAPPAYVGPGPFPPMPLPRDEELTAYALGKGDKTPTTEVYDITTFAHLQSGTESEQRQQFERLIRSREQAKDAQINWFDNKPVVRTTTAGHRAVRECVSVLLGSETTAKQFDEFLNNVTTRERDTVVVDLQFVTMNDDAYSDLEDAVIELAENEQGIDDFPLVMPAEKWDSLREAIPHDNTWQFLAPQLAVYNGRTVHIESVAQHPPVSVRTESPYRTHGGLLGASDWLGWKALALPVVRDDGESFWLGMRFEVRSLPEAVEDSTKSDAEKLQVRRHEVGFTTTLREGQVVVLPGLNVNYGGTSDSNGSTFLAARVRKADPIHPANALPSPQPMSGSGVGSDAGVAGELVVQTNATQKPEPAAAPALSPPSHIRRQGGDETSAASLHSGQLVFKHGGCRLEAAPKEGSELDVAIDSDELTVMKAQLTLMLTRTDGFGFTRPIQMQAEQCRISQGDLLKVELSGNVLLTAPQQLIRAKADSLLMMIPATGNVNAEDGIKCLMKNVAMTIQMDPATDSSLLRAEEISIVLDAKTFESSEISASKVESLRVSDAKRTAVESNGLSPVFSDDRKLLSQWDTIRGERSLQNLVSPKFDRTPLKEAVAWFRTAGDLNIILDELAIEEEGIIGTTPVTLELNEVAIHSALRLLLKPLNLGITIDEESSVVIVTSKLRMQGKMVAAAYPVADLVIPIPKSVVVRLSDAGAFVLQPDSSPLSDEVTQVSGVAYEHSQLDMDSISELITTVVEPDSWQEVGGLGTLRANETTLSLVIRQTQEVHREVSDLLDQLRRLQDTQVSLQMQTLELPNSFLADWNDDLIFKPLSESTTHRYMRLSSAQADELRSAGKSGQFPKVTLFNGQLCEFRMDEQNGMKQSWHVQPVVSGDRRSVRLGVGIDSGRSGAADEAVPTSVTTVFDGDAILVEVNGSADKAARIVGEPIPGQPRAFRRVSQPRRFVLIQPKVVIVEEEKELLSIDLEK